MNGPLSRRALPVGVIAALAMLMPAAGDAAHKRHRHHPHRVVATKAATSGSVLRVGTYKGIPGQYSSIQAALDAAQPGDWILVGPGDYHEQADHRANRGPQPADTPAGVVLSTPHIHLRGMDRNTVVVDGTKPGASKCSSNAADQDLGPTGSDGKPLGRNGILIWKANDTWVENLTVCNFLNGAGSAGNEIWWNGGDGSGVIGESLYWGDYLTGTSTYYKDTPTAASYAIFSSDATKGWWDHTYGSNMADSNYYVGACQTACDLTMNHAWSEFGSLGYSGTNSGGNVLIENSQFDNNKDGFDTNSQNNSDWPSPQDGSCPNGATSPITHTHSCWVFIHNYVHDNNNPNVPGIGVASNGPTGTGMSVSGGRNDTIMDNTFVHNGAWGIVFVPYPDTETAPANTTAAGAACQGGISAGAPTNAPAPTYACYYDDWGNAIVGNTFKDNGFFGNDTNGDFGEITSTPAPTNCFHGNHDSSGTVTSSPAGLEQSKPTCDGSTAPPDPNPSMTNQVACDTQFFASLLPGGSTPCTPGSNYPASTGVVMHPLPPASQLESMPNPCAGVPANPWCASAAARGHSHRKHASVKHKHRKKHAKKHPKKHAKKPT